MIRCHKKCQSHTAGFTVLRELTATDLKGSLLQLLYESGQSEMEWGTAFFMSRANKKEGSMLIQ